MRITRRTFLTALLAAAAQAARATEAAPVRIGLTPVFLSDQIAFLSVWREYLEAKLGRPVKFARRASYREVVEMLLDGKLEFAWLCGYPFVAHRSALELVAVPLYRGRPLYQSYLIVPAQDLHTSRLAELKSTVFAYSDPDSNSGFLVVQDALRRLGENSTYFFRKAFFTWSHRKVIEAVAARLANAGAVDGYVYESLAHVDPELIAGTRVVERSVEFGFPPFVARRGLPESEVLALRGVLIGMRQDAGGAALLQQLNLDGFVRGEPGLYDGIARMAAELKRSTHAS